MKILIRLLAIVALLYFVIPAVTRQLFVKREPRGLQELRRKADAGDPEAMTNLGTLYVAGEGVRPDPKRGLALVRKAAESGFAEAEIAYGILRLEEDPEEGEAWIRRAAEQGHPLAMGTAGMLTLSRWRDGDDAAERDRAVDWLLRGARTGTPNMWYFLADLYLRGRFVPQDFALARRWFERAAREGVALAKYPIGRCYFEGVGGPRDLGQARRWLTEARAAGDVDAAAMLKRIPADVKMKGKMPVVVGWDELARDFAASPEKADEKYLTETVDLAPVADASRLRLKKQDQDLLLSLDGSATTIRLLPAAVGVFADVRLGDPVRCRYRGLRDGEAVLDLCACVDAAAVAATQRDGLPLPASATMAAAE